MKRLLNGAKLTNKLAKVKVLIIDGFGLATLANQEQRELLEVIEGRQGLTPTVIVSQVLFEAWHENIGDPTIADTILDRLVHNAHKFNLHEKSIRKRKSSLTKKENSET